MSSSADAILWKFSFKAGEVSLSHLIFVVLHACLGTDVVLEMLRSSCFLLT